MPTGRRPLAVPSARLTAFRVLVAGYALVYLLVRAPAIFALARRPAEAFAPVGVLSFLHAPLPPFAVPLAWALAVASAALVVWGRGGQAVRVAFAAALLVVLTYRNAWGMVFHTENLLVLHAIVLACARDAGDRVGTLLAPAPAARTAEGWPLRLAAAVTALSYVLAGVAKVRLSGFDWIFDETLRHYVAYDNVRKLELGAAGAPLGPWLLALPGVFPPLAAATLVFELGFFAALLHRRAAAVLCAVAWCFHLGVLLTMAIFFPYPLSGVAFAPFFHLERPAGWLPNAARRGLRGL